MFGTPSFCGLIEVDALFATLGVRPEKWIGVAIHVV